MKAIVTFVLLILLLGFLFTVHCAVLKSDEDSIRAWAAEQNLEVINFEMCIFDWGPFWYKGDEQRVYKIELSHNRVFYMRTGLYENEFLEHK